MYYTRLVPTYFACVCYSIGMTVPSYVAPDEAREVVCIA